MQTPEEKMTSVTVKELADWTEDDIEEELHEIEQMKFVPYHFKIYKERLEAALVDIYLTRGRISKLFEQKEW